MTPTQADSPVLDAGSFAQWLEAMRGVLRGERDAQVPCGECVGCCVSFYPIPLRPADSVALAHVPAAYLHLPTSQGGLAWMGYRPDGTCPMLDCGGCTIYVNRPRTCRDYDCRIYAAAGLLPDGDRPIIRQRVQQWRFGFDSPADRLAADAVERAAWFIRHRALDFPPSMRAGSATAAAVLALKCHEIFVENSLPESDEAALALVGRVIDAVREFDAGMP